MTARLISFLFATVSATAMAVRPQMDLNKGQTVQQAMKGERSCVKEDWQLVFDARSVGILKSDSLPTSTCRAVTLTWFPSARIVQVIGVEHIDVFVSMTFIRADGHSPIRLVRALGGLVENRDREDDPANKAVFNELLRKSAIKPTENEILDLASLYLFMVGHPPDEPTKKLSDAITTNDILGAVTRQHRWTVVTVHQRVSRFGPFGNPSKNWVVKFRNGRSGLRLVSVSPE